MFQRILVANRGEIALRVIRACRDLGIEVACVYSEADRDAPYLKLADKAICIGPGPASESYLKVQRIIAAAEVANADAIHPGYGFLSENAQFANICRECRFGAGDSSTSFWCRRWELQSRSYRWTTLPCLSPRIWTSMCRGWTRYFSR